MAATGQYWHWDGNKYSTRSEAMGVVKRLAGVTV